QTFERAVEVGGRRDRPCADLRRNDYLVADTAAGTPPAEQRLTLTALRAVHKEQVVVRGVNEIPARRDVPVQDRERRRFVGRRAEPHRAQAEHADLARRQRVASDGRVSHASTLTVRAHSKSSTHHSRLKATSCGRSGSLASAVTYRAIRGMACIRAGGALPRRTVDTRASRAAQRQSRGV